MTIERAIVLTILLIWGLLLFHKKWNSYKLDKMLNVGYEEYEQWKRENKIIFNPGEQYYYCDDWQNINPFKKPNVYLVTIQIIKEDFILYSFISNGVAMSLSCDVDFAAENFKKLTDHIVNTDKFIYQ